MIILFYTNAFLLFHALFCLSGYELLSVGTKNNLDWFIETYG